MICFAYDATINGDWVSRYAVRLAGRHPERRLRVLCVDEGRLPRPQLLGRLELLGEACAAAGVAFEPHVLAPEPDVHGALDRAAPAGPAAHLVLGTRVRVRGRGLLAGSIGERMLREGRRNVLVLRVLQPGLLGRPREFLIPLGGHRQGFAPGLAFLRLFAADLSVAHLVHVRRVGAASLRRLTPARTEALRRDGLAYCRGVEREITAALGVPPERLHAHVLVSDDPAREIVVLAARLRSELVYLGASERGAARRLLAAGPIERVLRDAPCDVAVHRGLP